MRTLRTPGKRRQKASSLPVVPISFGDIGVTERRITGLKDCFHPKAGSYG